MPVGFSLLPTIPAASLLTLFVLLCSTLVRLQQLCVAALPDVVSLRATISSRECSALAQLAQQWNLSTNCNCSAHLGSSNPFLPCNGSCGAHSDQQGFASCSTDGLAVSELHLSGMELRGWDMKWVANFKHIEYLDLSDNGLNGTIPSSLWSLGKLAYANLSVNHISGHIPSFNSDTLNSSYPLLALDLSHNQIEGPLPHNLCVRFPSLTRLLLSNNTINGSIAPLSLCNRLEVIDASLNNLQGPLLEDLEAKSALKPPDLKENHPNGSTPPSLSAVMPHLVQFDVSYNNLSGNFSLERDLTPLNLSLLNVSHNNLDVGLGADLISEFGLSSFWPNRACKECFPATTPSPSPSAQSVPPSSESFSARPSPSLTLPANKAASHDVKGRVDAILGIIVGCIAGVIVITIISCVVIHRRRQRITWPLRPKRPAPAFKNGAELAGPFSFESQSGTWVADVKDPSSVPVVIFEKPLLNLTFADLLQATKSFNREFEAGDGTGLVYTCGLPGVVDGDGKVIIEVVEGGHGLTQEAAIAAFTQMGEVKHENLVPLLGYCIVGEEKLLIYRHMDGGSLEDALHAAPEEAQWSNVMGGSIEEDWHNMESWPDHHDLQAGTAVDSSSKTPCMDWESRHKVALGVARALAYLHHGCRRPTVHGAVSSSCILLDGSVAKVANYGGAWGLQRRLEPGYAPPECSMTHMQSAASSSKTGPNGSDGHACTSRCDVYGTGVVLLELATGRRAVGSYGSRGCETLVAWARMLRKGKRSEEAVDQRLPCAAHAQLVEMMKVGCLCTADSPSKRPSMQQVVGLLKDITSLD